MTYRKTPPPIHPPIHPLTAVGIGVITLGIYPFIWASRRVREANPHPRYMSHWTVPVCMVIIMIALSRGMTTVVPFIVDPALAAAISVYGNYALFLTTIGLGTWWLVYHFYQIDREQKLLPLILMTFFFSPLALYYLQMRINGLKRDDAMSIQWLTVAVAGVLSAGIATVILINFPIRPEIQRLEVEYRTANSYIQCHEDLGVRYPNEEITPYQYQAYVDDYEDCEAIINQ